MNNKRISEFIKRSRNLIVSLTMIAVAALPTVAMPVTVSAAPSGPTGLTASIISGTTAVKLTWVSNSKGTEQGFHIKRATDSAFKQNPLGFATNTGVTTYIDTETVAGTTYYYRVTSWDKTGDSFLPIQ